jgi:energy-coupling factor transport system permease protein
LGELGNTQLFGRVSWDALFGALRDGLRMASILVSVGLANTLANPRQLLKNTPGALYEVASAWVIAINMAPQLIDSAKRVKRASRLRGRNKRHNLLGSMLIPVLEDTIERSLALAASMSARGFGRQGQLRNRQLLALRLASFVGVTCLTVGAYLLLTSPSPWMAAVLLAVGILGVGATSRVAALRQIRTRYQPTSWAVRDALLVATAVAIVCFALSGAI